ncbi:hypothetical protein [Enterococcus sp.]|uniref:hypothetical protein n=1 Tax=Enterococcus sp. TaxID=35783 RepID=UPI002FC7D6EF
MKLTKKIKEKVIETAEHLYDLSKKDLFINISKDGVEITEKRPTKQTIKWRSKGH